MRKRKEKKIISMFACEFAAMVRGKDAAVLMKNKNSMEECCLRVY